VSGASGVGEYRRAESTSHRVLACHPRGGLAFLYWFAFGPTNVAIHRAWLSLELGDPSQAVELAERVPYDRLPAELAERRASHLITVAWANYLRRRDRGAIDALKSARESAPEQLVFTRRVHSMLRGILRRDRRWITNDLRELAEFVGVLG
jgi:hypothetical protein